MDPLNIVTDPEFQSFIPPLSIGELRALEENILANGCRDPLVVWNGLLLDGHNRLTICREHKIDFTTVEAKGIADRDDAKAWIIKNQLGRRNISDGSRAILATTLEEIYARKAKDRQAEQARRNQPQAQKVANLPPLEKAKAREQAADAMGVSPRLVQAAKAVVTRGSEKLLQAVMAGKATVSAAAEIATLSKAKQDKIVDSGKKAIVAAAGDVRRERRAESPQAEGKRKLTAKQLARLVELVTKLDRLTDKPGLEISPIHVRECVAEIMKIVL